MQDGTMNGPDFLEEYANRAAANGFDIEADEMRRRAKEWNADKQTIENGEFCAVLAQRQDGILVTAIEADFEKNTITVQPRNTDYRISGGTYQLIPVLA